jgi:hypothetical protein
MKHGAHDFLLTGTDRWLSLRCPVYGIFFQKEKRKSCHHRLASLGLCVDSACAPMMVLSRGEDTHA